MMRKFLLPLLLLFSLSHCQKVVVHGKDRPMEPLIQKLKAPSDHAFEAARKALLATGYEIQEQDAGKKILRTTWVSTQATSHYTDLFDQKDYGTVGAYYHLRVLIREEGPHSVVEISAPVRSLVAHQKSSYREERKVLKKMKDILRSDSFEMTNLGVE